MSRWQTGCMVVLAAAVLAVAVAVYALKPAPAPSYDTTAVDKGKVVAKVTATGTLSALVTVQVGSQVSGRVQAWYADFNDPVTKDQLIAKIDPQLFEAALEQAKANAAAAEANLAKAKVQAADARRQYERAKALADRQLVSLQERDTAQTTADAADAAVRAAQAQVAQAQASLHQAEVNLAYTDIHSPINGTVISRSVDVGQTVAASLQAPTLFVLAEDLHKMQVDTSVAEADVGRLRKDMSASFTVDAWPGETFEGTVREVRNAPTTVQNVVTYDAVVDVENPDLHLKPGMTANVTFVWDERDDVLRVPNTALRWHPSDAKPTRPEGGGRTVYVLKDGQPVAVVIKTGLTDGTVTEVVSGDLKEGDALITDASDASAKSGGGSSGGGGSNAFRRGF